MANIESRIRSANRALSSYIPPPDPSHPTTSAPSRPYLQWCFSEPDVWDHVCPPLWFIGPDTDLDGNPIYDYICECGTNVHVHSPTCKSFVIPKTRMTKVKIAQLIDNSWILCRWTPPPSPDEWVELYGTLDNYPRTGRYLPVASNNKTISLPADQPPFPETSNLVISMFKEHEDIGQSVSDAIINKHEKRDYTMPLRPDGGVDHGAGVLSGSQAEKYQHYFKDRMTFPGPKVYQPGLGENPVITRKADVEMEKSVEKD